MDNLECEVDSKHKNTKSIPNQWKENLSHLFDYDETEPELKISIEHYLIYYNKIKKWTSNDIHQEDFHVNTIQNSVCYSLFF